ncbi:hypothetical protein M0R45_008870 [Rubus argutus]|uniref:Uncharacterized protein n=1 Tax=Rubus argutus TaxID=59490 RepID=A0AAW1Y469_RUBAR
MSQSASAILGSDPETISKSQSPTVIGKTPPTSASFSSETISSQSLNLQQSTVKHHLLQPAPAPALAGRPRPKSIEGSHGWDRSCGSAGRRTPVLVVKRAGSSDGIDNVGIGAGRCGDDKGQ